MPIGNPQLIHSHPQSYRNVLYLFSFRGTLNGMIRENKNEAASPVCTYLEATGRSCRGTSGDWSLGSHCAGAAGSKVSRRSVNPRRNLREAWPLALTFVGPLMNFKSLTV